MPSSFTVGEVTGIVRKKLSMGREQGLFLLANGKHIMKQSAALSDVFKKHKDSDGFLYIFFA
jgi:microtubule-associated protein 1 light chain